MVTVYRGQRRALCFLPGIISTHMMIRETIPGMSLGSNISCLFTSRRPTIRL